MSTSAAPRKRPRSPGAKSARNGWSAVPGSRPQARPAPQGAKVPLSHKEGLRPSERAEERELAQELFGKFRDEDSDVEAEVGEDEVMQWLREGGSPQEAAESAGDETAPESKRSGLRPVWVDEDDSLLGDLGMVSLQSNTRLKKLRSDEDEDLVTTTELEQKLRVRFRAHAIATDWAELDDGGNLKYKPSETGDDDKDGVKMDEYLASSTPLIATGSERKRLQESQIAIKRCKDANQHGPSEATVRAARFHPAGRILLTAGFDKTVRFFSIDGVHNDKLHSMHIPNFPVHDARFLGPAGDKVCMVSRRPFFYMLDVESGHAQRVAGLLGRKDKSLETFTASADGRTLAFVGNDGYVLLADTRTKALVWDVKMNGTARSVAFSGDSTRLLTSGGDAEVYTWDLRSQVCLHRYANEGGTVTSAMLCTNRSHGWTPGQPGSEGFTLIGSESGVVNVYDSHRIDEIGRRVSSAGVSQVMRPTPLRGVLNLRTTIDTIAATNDAQAFVICSRFDRDAVRLVHLPSGKVFSNWPAAGTPLRYVFCADFSPSGGYLVLGNDRGRVLLYRLLDYAKA